jgi:hypothetical protein
MQAWIATAIGVGINVLVLAFWAGRKERDLSRMKGDIDGVRRILNAHVDSTQQKYLAVVRVLNLELPETARGRVSDLIKS